jgi:hypothetical protein
MSVCSATATGHLFIFASISAIDLTAVDNCSQPDAVTTYVSSMRTPPNSLARYDCTFAHTMFGFATQLGVANTAYTHSHTQLCAHIALSRT